MAVSQSEDTDDVRIDAGVKWAITWLTVKVSCEGEGKLAKCALLFTGIRPSVPNPWRHREASTLLIGLTSLR